MSIRLSQLTNGERLILDRRRRKENQTQAAKRLGVDRKTLYLLETDQQESPRVPIGKLKDHEIAFLYRRRAGLSRHELAKVFGVNIWWITRMERGELNCQRLLNFWGYDHRDGQ
jgi:DNA-binding XRE family transcriptional regulator